LSIDMLAASDGPVDVTVTRSTSALSSALSTFADAYNAAATELDNQRGQSGGALQGNSIVLNLQQTLSSLSTYSGSGGQVNGLSDLGLSLGTNGQITFDAFSLDGTDISDSAG